MGFVPALALLLGVVSTPPTTEQQVPAAGQLDVKDAALLRAVRGIAGRVENLRGERFDPAAGAARTPEEMLDVAAQLRASTVLDRTRLAARGRAWSDIGFGGTGAPEALVRALAGDLDGIAFDASANRLLFAPHRLTEEDFAAHDADDPAAALLLAGIRPDAPVVAHLLMHAMQRQRSGRDHLADTTDELLARAAWAEGEANFVAVRYLFSGMALQEDVVDATLDPSQYLDGKLVPPATEGVSGVEVALLRFVYFEGYAQAVERFADGHWARIDRDAAQEHTTRQVLHPGAAKLDGTLPDPSPPFPGLALADRDTLGEQGVITFVSRLTGKDNLALQAGDGWSGDMLCRWEGDAGAVTEWVTRWASPEDVEDFDYALGRAIGVRFPGTVLQRDDTGHTTLVTDDRVLRVERRGNVVRFLVATPELGRAWVAKPQAAN